MSDYPTSIYDQRVIENVPGVVYDAAKKTRIFAEDVQEMGDEITAIETTLGTNPQGAFSDVDARLNALPTFDADGNLPANNILYGYQTHVTSGTPVVLTASSPYMQFFTGSTAQTVKLPLASSVTAGYRILIINNSTANLALTDSTGLVNLGSLPPNTFLIWTIINPADITLSDLSFSGVYTDGLYRTLQYTKNFVFNGTSTTTTVQFGGGGTVQYQNADIPIGAHNIVPDTTTGMKIGTATNQKIGFFNSTPIVKGTAFTQTYSTASHTMPNDTATDMPTGGTGTAAGGWSTAANRNAAIAAFAALRVDVDNTKQVLNALIDDLQALGLIA